MSTLTLPTTDILTRSVATVTVSGTTRKISKLLGNADSNTKLRKSTVGFEVRGFSMLPHTLGGIGNVCPFAGACADSCLTFTGMAAVFNSVSFGRLCRRMLWHQNREWFLDRLNAELHHLTLTAKKNGKRAACRLNVFSDIPWEKFGVIDNHPDIEFWDYTKDPRRVGQIRPNYWVTFSLDEKPGSLEHALEFLKTERNVAAVWHNPGRGFVGNRSKLQTLPDTWLGFDVHSAEESDLRFEDDRGVWQGLKLKAANTAKRNAAIDSGFSIPFIPN